MVAAGFEGDVSGGAPGQLTGGAQGVIVSGPFVATLSNLVVRNPATGNAVVVRGGADAGINSCTLSRTQTRRT